VTGDVEFLIHSAQSVTLSPSLAANALDLGE
jgi:hypothetical protein